MPSGHRPQPPVGTARVAISGTGAAGNPWVNVFWLNLTATTHVAADLHTILNSTANAYDANFKSQISSAYHYNLIKGSWIYAAGNVIEQAITLAAGGTASATEELDSTATLINWAISDYYRGGHPRTYLPGTPAVDVSNGRNLVGAYQSATATAANAFLTAVNALTAGGISACALGTVRFASGNAWLSPPVFRAYNGATVNPIVATQRRRLAR
jgi:hypothetical protein